METTYIIGADTTGLGYYSMTMGIKRSGEFTPASREAAKREALRRWTRLGYRLNVEQIGLYRVK